MLFVTFRIVDVSKVRQGFAQLDVIEWVGALLAFVLLHALSAMKWRFFLSLVGARLPVRVALRCHAAGLFANLCLPSLIGGDVLRAGLALPSTDRRTALVVGSVVDRVADLSALITVAVLGLAAAPWARERLGADSALPVAAAILGGGALCGSLALAFFYRRARRLPRKLGRKVVEVVRAVTVLRKNPTSAMFGFACAVTLQAAFVLVNVALGSAVGLDLPLSLWFLLWPLAKVAAMLPLGFGGIGVREIAFAALVRPFGDDSLAVTQSLIWQTVLISGGLICGAYWTFWPAPRPTVRPDAT